MNSESLNGIEGQRQDGPMASCLLMLMLFYPGPSYGQSFHFLSDDELPALQERDARFRTVLGRDEPTRPDPSKETIRESEYRPAREIKRFTEPTILLRGTAEDIGLDSRTLDSFLEMKFLQNFAFLQSVFAFDKTYETWEIGLFECEVWTVGSNYPIAFHVQCAGGSMDEPRHWRTATLGYGPKGKIVEMVKSTLDSIVEDYATFVQKAHGRNGS
jgi:hypothetical protein